VATAFLHHVGGILKPRLPQRSRTRGPHETKAVALSTRTSTQLHVPEETLLSQVRMDGDTEAGMSVVQNNRGTTAGGITGRGFVPGQSGNPGGRPKGLTRRVRQLVGDDGTAIAEFMYAVMVDDGARTADRLEAARWLADRGFGKPPQDVELALRAQETIDVHAFAAFAAKYLPSEMLDEMILSVERRMEAERTLPASG
jgi:Family of unknown function (DUF5681)